MASTNESRLWGTLRPHLAKYGHFTRIESSTVEGIPDVYGVVLGEPAWIELKVLTGQKIPLREGQVAWLTKHAACGGRAYVLARRSDEIRIWNGEHAPLLVQPGAWSHITPLGKFSKKYDYEAIVAAMFGSANKIMPGPMLRALVTAAQLRRDHLLKTGPPRNECATCFVHLEEALRVVGFCEEHGSS